MSSPDVPPSSLVQACRRNQLVMCHGYKQTNKLFGSIQVVLPRAGTQEKASKDGLANIHRVQESMQSAITELQPNFATDQGLVLADQLQGRFAISSPDPLYEIPKTTVLWHERLVIGQSRSHSNQSLSRHRSKRNPDYLCVSSPCLR